MEYAVVGSRVYGGAKSDSDLDIVMLEEEAAELRMELKKLGINIENNPPTTVEEYRDFQDNFYFRLGEMKINIVALAEEEEYEAWIEATKHMMVGGHIEDKEERRKAFIRYLWTAGLQLRPRDASDTNLF